MTLQKKKNKNTAIFISRIKISGMHIEKKYSLKKLSFFTKLFESTKFIKILLQNGRSIKKLLHLSTNRNEILIIIECRVLFNYVYQMQMYP